MPSIKIMATEFLKNKIKWRLLGKVKIQKPKILRTALLPMASDAAPLFWLVDLG